jgi:DHA1 family bicyclomycin/chloramphenicol resistance-like MFS transporter
MIGAFANRRLLHRGVPGKTLLTGGLVILVTSAFVLLFYAATHSGGVAGIMVPYFAYCVALSLVQPNAIAAGMEPVPHMAGTGASLMGAIQMASGAAAGYVVNLFFHGTATPMGIGVAVAALGAAASYYFIARR